MSTNHVTIDFQTNHALKIATEAHRGQTRKHMDVPYILHPMRVATRALDLGLSLDAVEAGLLHDVVEDSQHNASPVTAEMLADDPLISTRTILLVALLTKWWADDAPADVKAKLMPVYYGRILDDIDAVILKLIDRLDNLKDMAVLLDRADSTPNVRKWATRYLQKTAAEFPPLLQRAAESQRVPTLIAEFQETLAVLQRHPRRLD